MECRRVNHVMDEYLDGLLDGAVALEVVRHIEGCAACRRLADDLQRLTETVRLLPEEVQPPAHLWDRVAKEISNPGGAAILRGRFGRIGSVALAAAAGLTLVVAAVVAVRQVHGPRATAVRETDRGTFVVPAALIELGLDDELARVRLELRSALADRRSSLAPEAAAVVDENLAVIERALTEISRAVQANPGDQQLVRLLLATYQQEIDVLSQVSLAPAV